MTLAPLDAALSRETYLPALDAAIVNGDGPGALRVAEAALTGPGPTGVRAVGLATRTEAPVVVTLGGEGALVVEPGGMVEHLPPRPATVCDTTGAGDTFNGVLAAQLAAGAALLDAARAANVGAALSVGHVGARVGMPTAEAIEAAM